MNQIEVNEAVEQISLAIQKEVAGNFELKQDGGAHNVAKLMTELTLLERASNLSIESRTLLIWQGKVIASGKSRSIVFILKKRLKKLMLFGLFWAILAVIFLYYAWGVGVQKVAFTLEALLFIWLAGENFLKAREYYLMCKDPEVVLIDAPIVLQGTSCIQITIQKNGNEDEYEMVAVGNDDYLVLHLLKALGANGEVRMKVLVEQGVSKP